VDDTLKKLLAAETAASELVDNAQKEAEQLMQSALHEARLQEERFQARVPEMHAALLEKSDQRAKQTVAEMERRFHERFDQLRKDADMHEEAAVEAAFHELLGAGRK
jgi:vacuolar-type H+-ATPase subunit H